jgi:hypothetical protein
MVLLPDTASRRCAMSIVSLSSRRHWRRRRVVPAVLTAASLTELILIRRGRTYGSTAREQSMVAG